MKNLWVAIFACVVGFSGAVANAQATTTRVDARDDWSYFKANSPTECWAVSAPKETVNTDRNGNPKQVNRSEIRLFVFHRPSARVQGQVAFTGGYPFAAGKPVRMVIGGTTYELSTKGEWAWPPTPGDDAKIVNAMKRGARAVLTGESGRGTITKDTFSLTGFTAMYDAAAAGCS